MKRFFITGIGTNVGKTVVSAILTEKLQADYWKPVQSGTTPQTDTQWVRGIVSNPHSKFFKEAYCLKYPGSPHYSAKLEGVTINIEDIKLPPSENHLIIEGAGGLLVPLNEKNYIIELALTLDAAVILVVQNYLGSINHTLLSLEWLFMHQYPVKGIIFNGETYDENEKIIELKSPYPVLGRVPFMKELNKKTFSEKVREINITI